MKKYKIKSSAIATSPIRAVYTTLLIVLAMDHWNAPEWMWGVMITILFIAWIALFMAMAREVEIDPFEEQKTEYKKTSFQQRLEELAKRSEQKN